MDTLRKVLADEIRTENSTEQYLEGIQLLWNMVFEDKMPEDPSWIKSKALKECAQRKVETKTSDAASEMTVEEVETFGKKLARKVRQFGLEDMDRVLTPKEVKICMWHLILEWHMLLSKEHRRQVKVHELPILQKGQHIEGMSYLLQTSQCKGDYKLVLEDGNRISLTKMLSKYLHRTLRLIPRDHFLTSITQPQTAMTANNWSMFLGKIQYNGKRFNPDRL